MSGPSEKKNGNPIDPIKVFSLEDGPDPKILAESPLKFDVHEAVESLGFGRFQVRLSVLTGMAWMADSMEMTLLALLSPALSCDWGISNMQQALLTTCVFTGMFLSSTFWGRICDRYGRKVGIRSCILITFVLGAATGLSPNFYVLLILRSLMGFGVGGVAQSVTLYAEFLPTAHRAKCVVLIEAFWAVGAVLEALIAYLVMDTFGWRGLTFISSLPIGLLTILACWLPESARFDIANGRPAKALETLQKAAKENGVKLPDGELSTAIPADSSAGAHTSLLNLLKPKLRITTILLWIIWATNAFSYYGIALFTTVIFQSKDVCHGGTLSNETIAVEGCHQLVDADYLAILSTNMAEIPGIVCTVFIIEWIGRKKTMAVEFAVFSVFVGLLFFCLERTIITIFIFVARAAIAGAFQCAYVYTPEIYPTTLRATGVGAASGMARLGSILTPFVAQVASGISLNFPIAIYATTSLIGVIASLLLPIETTGRKMMEFH